MGKGYLPSQIFKQKTTPNCLVTRKRIAWTVEEMEMLISMNMVGRAEVIFIKAMEPGRVGLVRSMKPYMLPSPRLTKGLQLCGRY